MYSSLLDHIELKPTNELEFQGASLPLGFPNLYGGQVFAQSVTAIQQSLKHGFKLHSIHGLFLHSGTWNDPLFFKLNKLSSGASFSRIGVEVRQREKLIFTAQGSLKKVEAAGFFHSDSMPEVTPPEQLESDQVLREKQIDQLPEAAKRGLSFPKPIEVRQVDPIDLFSPVIREPKRYFWFRFIGAESAKSSPTLAIKQSLLAYASDYGVIGTALLPHGITWHQGHVFVTSLDHSIWFYQDFNIEDWFLFETESPIGNDGRSLIQGKIFARSTGRLLAVVTQEALIRERRSKLE